MHDAVKLEGAGIPAAVIVQEGFRELALMKRRQMGLEALEPVFIPGVLGSPEQARKKGEEASARVVEWLTEPDRHWPRFPRRGPVRRVLPEVSQRPRLRQRANLVIASRPWLDRRRAGLTTVDPRKAARTETESTWQAFHETIESFYDKGWTDGLPVIPPTQDTVERMLETVHRDPTEALGEVPPRNGVATVEAVAANAVMAGCRPEYFPVVLAAVEAILEEPFNLNGVQATTNAAAPLTIISGPIVQELNVNSGTNVFGHGYRANATIGRAVRLVMVVIGGGYPETGDKAPLGQPGKFSYCIAESPAIPWEPLHVERGLAPGESGVTVIGVDGPRSFTTAEDLDRRPRSSRLPSRSPISAIMSGRAASSCWC